jgi:hypothetical protein
LQKVAKSYTKKRRIKMRITEMMADTTLTARDRATLFVQDWNSRNKAPWPEEKFDDLVDFLSRPEEKYGQQEQPKLVTPMELAMEETEPEPPPMADGRRRMSWGGIRAFIASLPERF